MKLNLDMKTMEDGDVFNFVIGGTAYVVATWWQRPWIPIAKEIIVQHGGQIYAESNDNSTIFT
ncbi:hypothetical protein ACT453_30160, partial [Bacillus sp. D-CC]